MSHVLSTNEQQNTLPAQRIALRNRLGLKFFITRMNPGCTGQAAFVLHGHSGSSTEPHIQVIAGALMEAGKSVIAIDATHSLNGSDGDLSDGTLETYLQDLDDTIAHARSMGWVSGKYILAGHSMGGCALMFHAALHPDDVSHLAPISTAVSGHLVRKGFEENAPEFYADWKRDGAVKVFNQHSLDEQGKPREGIRTFQWLADNERFDIMPLVDRLTMPKLLVVGTKDTPTPPRDQLKLLTALPVPVTYEVVEGAGHTYAQPQYLHALAKHVRNWLKSHP